MGLSRSLGCTVRSTRRGRTPRPVHSGTGAGPSPATDQQAASRCAREPLWQSPRGGPAPDIGPCPIVWPDVCRTHVAAVEQVDTRRAVVLQHKLQGNPDAAFLRLTGDPVRRSDLLAQCRARTRRKVDPGIGRPHRARPVVEGGIGPLDLSPPDVVRGRQGNEGVQGGRLDHTLISLHPAENASSRAKSPAVRNEQGGHHLVRRPLKGPAHSINEAVSLLGALLADRPGGLARRRIGAAGDEHRQQETRGRRLCG